jgi:hypothetical protein
VQAAGNQVLVMKIGESLTMQDISR